MGVSLLVFQEELREEELLIGCSLTWAGEGEPREGTKGARC